jgi:O-antigen ligase
MKKLHQFLFFLLLVLLPVQLGRHFWPDFSLVFGIRVDYLSPTVYLTDILVVGILGNWVLEKIGDWKMSRGAGSRFAGEIGDYAKRYWWIIAVFCFLLINVFLSKNQGVALYKLVKIVEFALLGFYVAKNKVSLSIIHYPLSIALISSSFLAMAQSIIQRSLDGPFWWLGERTFNALTPGIAQAVWDGRLILRPYATFPHPNALAGFILVSLILIVKGKTQNAKRKVIKWLTVIIGAIAIAISFSRSVWIVGLVAFLLILLRHLRGGKSKLLGGGGILLLILTAVGFFFLVPRLSADEAISRRLQLNQIAFEMIQENPLVGVGLNNFIPRLPDYWQTSEAVRFLQPVHNLFLLVAAETGLIGLLIFLWFLILTFKNLLEIVPRSGIPLGGRNLKLAIPLLVILLLGVVDHYWLTLQQTQLLLTIILGLSWVKH